MGLRAQKTRPVAALLTVYIRTYQTLHKTTVKKWQNKMEAVEMGLEVIKEIGTNLYAIHKSKERKSRFPTVY